MKPKPSVSHRSGVASASPNPFARAQELAIEHRYPELLALLRELAEQGEPAAQRTLGEMLFHGHPAGDKPAYRNRAEAGQWFRRAAAQGCPIARYYLDWFYGDDCGNAAAAYYECRTVDRS
jgi:TPR repeat protein